MSESDDLSLERRIAGRPTPCPGSDSRDRLLTAWRSLCSADPNLFSAIQTGPSSPGAVPGESSIGTELLWIGDQNQVAISLDLGWGTQEEGDSVRGSATVALRRPFSNALRGDVLSAAVIEAQRVHSVRYAIVIRFTPPAGNRQAAVPLSIASGRVIHEWAHVLARLSFLWVFTDHVDAARESYVDQTALAETPGMFPYDRWCFSTQKGFASAGAKFHSYLRTSDRFIHESFGLRPVGQGRSGPPDLARWCDCYCSYLTRLGGRLESVPACELWRVAVQALAALASPDESIPSLLTRSDEERVTWAFPVH